MIGISRLQIGIRQIGIAVSNGRSEARRPIMSESTHRAVITKRNEIAIGIESSIAVNKTGVITHAADSVTINTKKHHRIIFCYFKRTTQINSPTKVAVVAIK